MGRQPTSAWRIVRILLVIVAVMLALAALLVAGAWKTESGARLLWQAAQRAVPGQLQGTLEGGTLADGLRLRDVHYEDAARSIRIDRADAAWDWSFRPQGLTIEHLRLGTVNLRNKPQPKEPAKLPQQLTLPLALHLRDVQVERLAIAGEASETVIRDIRLAGDSDGRHHDLRLLHAGLPTGDVEAALRLDGVRPFPLAGTARAAGTWQGKSYRLDATLSKTLEQPLVELTAKGDGIDAHALVQAAPFDPVPVREAHVTAKALDPQQFLPAIPHAQLDVQADLQPLPGSETQLRVGGDIRIRNHAPAPWDKGGIPASAASATLLADAGAQTLSNLRIDVPGGGQLAGNARFAGSTGKLELQASGVDPHALYSTLVAESLDGPLTYDYDAQGQHIVADLAGRDIGLRARADITPAEFILHEGTLDARGASLDLQGTMARTGERKFSARGTVHDFNPQAFLATRQKNAAARINGDFSAEGNMQPELAARLRFDIRDSSYADRPLSGRGVVQLAGKRLLDSDARLDIAGNTVQLRGAFGQAGQQLRFSIDAPALDRLAVGARGLLQAEGTLGGTLERPALDATARARDLAYAGYRAGTLDARAKTSGIPGRDANASILLDIEAAAIAAPDIALAKVSGRIDGTYASHVLQLQANGRLRGNPVTLAATAKGKLEERSEGLAWTGVLQSLENRGRPAFALEAPMDVAAAPGRVMLGSTRLTLEKAAITLDRFRYEAGAIATAGRIDALDTGQLLELQRTFTGKAPPVRSDMVLDGRWDLALAAQSQGSIALERKRGDVRVIDGPRIISLGLQALRLQGNFQGDRLQLDGRLDANLIGSATVTGTVGLLAPAGIALPAPESPLGIRIDATLPRLRRIASLAGPRFDVDGTLGGQLFLNGTLAAPLVSGDIAGSQLAFTLFDQGVRLRDGVLQARIVDNVAQLQRLEFQGGDGIVRATGSIPLDPSLPNVRADIVAERLQLLANPGANLTLSGKAAITNPDGQMRVDGRFVVDHARFTKPERSAPAVSDDVVVVRGPRGSQQQQQPAKAEPASAPPAPSPLNARIDIAVDLGDDFRFTGLGADLRLGGELQIGSPPGAKPQASGAVNIVDGTFEAFGAKLSIERGVLTFHGPLDNPDLNILAMRRNQDVAAGVQVSGTARQPRVQLVSEPEVAEEEKLSWLVFGHGSNTGETGSGLGAQAAAKTAALGLLNRFGGNRLAKGLGLSQLSLGTSEYGLGTQQVVSLGKEISDRLSIGYEQSLAGASGIVKLTYELSRHFSVVVRGGVVAGLDLFYNRRFDAINARGAP